MRFISNVVQLRWILHLKPESILQHLWSGDWLLRHAFLKVYIRVFLLLLRMVNNFFNVILRFIWLMRKNNDFPNQADKKGLQAY